MGKPKIELRQHPQDLKKQVTKHAKWEIFLSAAGKLSEYDVRGQNVFCKKPHGLEYLGHISRGGEKDCSTNRPFSQATLSVIAAEPENRKLLELARSQGIPIRHLALSGQPDLGPDLLC
jgi:hypothetical protein